jgi:hypothetical protein
VGSPIRKSADQSFFAAPRGLSQRSTSFIASQRQGIHQMPLRHLIALIINAHAPRRCSARSLHFLQTDTDLERPVCFTRSIQRHCGQATPTLPSPKLARRRTHGDCAHPVTHVTWSAWINLLFTMSDNTRGAAEASDVRIHFSQRTSEIITQDCEPSGGARRDRTDDLLLAKQALSQLSYGPVPVGSRPSRFEGRHVTEAA